ncbi:MAG TPA: hypothetical protein VEZ42_08480, partial [Pseudonocardia sp.]|nr:hypothetical protein [Pseudonocardia sp.]
MDIPDHRRLDPRRSAHPVSVEELVARCRPAPAAPTDRLLAIGQPGPGAAGPISVGALLRREGRARRAADRPLLPRGHSRPAPAPPAEATPLRLRRVAGAAGMLFTVTAVLAPAVLQDLGLRPDTGSGTALDGEGGNRPGAPGAPGGVPTADGGRSGTPAVALAAVVVSDLPLQRTGPGVVGAGEPVVADGTALTRSALAGRAGTAATPAAGIRP